MFTGFGTIVASLMEADPFVPFEIWLDGDSGILIENRERARVIDEEYSMLAVYDSEKNRTTFVNLAVAKQIRIRGKRLRM